MITLFTKLSCPFLQIFVIFHCLDRMNFYLNKMFETSLKEIERIQLKNWSELATTMQNQF